MLYEIINMSDKYTIEAHSLDIAFAACVFLGSGQYAFEPLADGGTKIPFFMFGGTDEWCKENLNNSMKDTIDSIMQSEARRLELADCFDSCLIGGAQHRKTYKDGLALIDDPAKRGQWKSKWHDDRRSSMNDIGGRAYKMAAKLRAGSTNPLTSAPVQVFAR